MRIQGPGGGFLSTRQSGPARAGSGTFTLSEPSASTHERAATNAARQGESLSALLAMQEVGVRLAEKLGEKRKRSVNSGRHALDILDQLKLGLLSGRPMAMTAVRLQSASTELRAICEDAELNDDPRLGLILSDIALRVQVELEKMRRI